MSRRLERLAMPTIHPRTGAPFAPIGYVNGRPVWPILGGAEGDAGASGGTSTGNDTGGQGAANDQGNDGVQGKPDDTAGEGDDSGDGGQSQTGDAGEGKDPRVTRANNEAQRYRQQLREEQNKNAQLLDNIAKALGLKDDEKVDPKVLGEQLATAQTEARASRIELAVYRAAGKAGADPDALLDSRAFLEKVKDLDPTKGDEFTTGISEAITAALEANPKLKAVAQVAGQSGADFAGGTGGSANGTGSSSSGGGTESIDDLRKLLKGGGGK